MNSYISLYRLMLTLVIVSFTLPAQAYIFRDDPNSTWGGEPAGAVASINGNLFTLTGNKAVNLSSNTLPELKFAVTHVWVGQGFQPPLQWSNTLNGWHTDNFDNQGTGLTIQLISPATQALLFGDIADGSGNSQLPVTQTSGEVNETRNLTDAIPYFSLGTFAPNEIKLFDLTFKYTYSDGRNIPSGLKPDFYANTLSAVPLPTAVWFFGSALGILGWLKKRHH